MIKTFNTKLVRCIMTPIINLLTIIILGLLIKYKINNKKCNESKAINQKQLINKVGKVAKLLTEK